MGGNVNFNNNGVFQWSAVQNQEGLQGAVLNRKSVSDDLSSLGNLGYNNNYIYNANNPHLPNPEDYLSP